MSLRNDLTNEKVLERHFFIGYLYKEIKSVKGYKNMTRVIIASKSEKLIAMLRGLLVGNGYEVVTVVSDRYDLKRQVKALVPNVVILDEELVLGDISLVETFSFEQQAVLFVGKNYQRAYYQQSPYLEFCEKPVQPNVLLMTLRMLTKYTDTVKLLESKINQLEKKQKIEKKIQMAKRELQLHQNMSENEAHQYIQKRSMELRISKEEFATRILKRFEKKA